MTNREMILRDAARLPGEALEKLLYGDEADRLDTIMCGDCQARFGDCPGGDDNCTLDMADWLEWPSARKTLLKGVLEDDE